MVQDPNGLRPDAKNTPFDLHKNELLIKAAELSNQFGVDIALLVSTPSGQSVKYASSGSAETMVKRLQELPVSDVWTKDQVMRQYQQNSLSTPASQHLMGSHWMLAGKQGAWLQLAAPNGQVACVPSLKPPGFLDASNYPVSPRADSSYCALTDELDRLVGLATAAKKRKLQDHIGNGSTGAGIALGSHQLSGVGTSSVLGGGDAGAAASKATRFKPLSVELPHQQVEGGTLDLGRAAGAAGEAAPGPAAPAQEHESEGLPLPSPSAFLASGPHSGGGVLGGSGQLDLLVTTRGTASGGRGLLLSGPGTQPHELLLEGGGQQGEMHHDLSTPNSSALVNLNLWSPSGSGALQGKAGPGFTTEDDDDGSRDATELQGSAGLLVQGKGITLGAGTGEAGGNAGHSGGDAAAGALGAQPPATAIDIPIDI